MNTKRKFSRRKIKNNVFSRSTYRKQKKKKIKEKEASILIYLFYIFICTSMKRSILWRFSYSYTSFPILR